MESPFSIINRPGPDCELTIKVKFKSVEKFRSVYREQIANSRYFIAGSRVKPPGTRIQLIWILEELNDLEIWSWGTVERAVTPEEASETGEEPGMELRLFDMIPERKKKIEKILALDPSVKEVLSKYRDSEQSTGYTTIKKKPHQSLEDRAKELIEMAENARDYYELLGVPKDAPEEKIRTAYRQMARRYHPDRFANRIPQELHERVEQAYQKIIDAYTTLKNPEKRNEYDIKIGNYLNPLAQRAALPHLRLKRAFTNVYKKMVGERQEQIQALLEDADRALQEDKPKLALSKLKLAKALDPLNPKVNKKLKEVQALIPNEEE